MKLVSLAFLSGLVTAYSRLFETRQLLGTFPSYVQQCDNDDGPRFENDAMNFGNGRYHTGGSATAVLQNGACAAPLQGACSSHNDNTQAYLEGPIDCGGNGFFCTVVEQDDWEPRELLRNANFGYCNSTEAFASHEYEADGHCHGSNDDSTYYWVLRDHWFRQYNGRMRCCCNWNSGDDNLFEGRFTNRCDYRRMIPKRREGDCVQANRNAGNYEGGCDSSLETTQVGSPVPEDDSKCWEITHFGQPKPVIAEGEPCEDDTTLQFKNIAQRNCFWVGRNPDRRCEREWEGKDLMEYCPKTCGLCPESADDGICEDDANFSANGRGCTWAGRGNTQRRCNRFFFGKKVSEHCPLTCKACP